MIRTFSVILAVMLCATADAANCTISSAGVSFGNYNALNHRVDDTSGRITVACSGTQTESVSYVLSLVTTAAKAEGRSLRGGMQLLHYGLFLNSARTQLWGDGTSGTSVIKDSITLTNGHASQDYAIYGRMPAGQNEASEGTYTDTAVITIAW